MQSVILAYICFSLFFLVLGGSRVEADDFCKPTNCSNDGPTIKFPFRNKNLSPKYCGHNPGFDVFCNQKNETVLILPSSLQFIVKKINYVSKQVDLYDPQQCLPKKLPYLNLSASPFNFSTAFYYFSTSLFRPMSKFNLDDFVLFNCSAPKSDFDPYNSIHCLDNSNYHFFAVPSGYNMNYLPLTSCTKIHEIPSIPNYIFTEDNLYLSWSETIWLIDSRLNTANTNHKAGASKVVEGATFGSIVFLLAIVVLLYIYIRAIKKNHMIEKFLKDQRALKPTRFSYFELRRITLNFSEKLGEGGYGTVYKGKLSTEINVAVKVLNNSKGNGEEFVNEVSTIGRIHHINVVRLVGFCAEGFRRALVFEFLPNDSLEKFIFQSSGSKKKNLGRQKLQDIAVGIAKGIEYLHEGCDRQILHLDIKPHNILLDQNFNPKICDFGLAKLCAREQSGVTMTAARGTMGYVAPEVLLRTLGRVSYKSDVYSFGMLLLEIVGVRKNIDPNVKKFGDELWAHVEEGEDGNVARRLTIVGLWCIQWCPTDRPSMKDVLQMLEGDEESLTIPPNPFPANANATDSVAARMIPAGRRNFETQLALIQESESEYFST